jgi:dGTPase
MSTRELFEQHQRQWLAPCAVHESDSGGRVVAEAEHVYRTCFQRDRDRIIHCSAFRRLSDKTQVFSPHTGDYSRMRLTHTVEVAQISRTLARALRLNEDVAEAVALAHDLGHPPFGHSGEAALNELMADHGHFEHNRQSLRVVDYLEHPYPGFRGLNLCRVIRECLAKHTSRYDTPVCEEFDPKLLAPLEGQLVDQCDEIAYTSADLEDALAVGWLTLEQLGGLKLWQQAWAVAQAESPDARDIHKRIRACKAVLATMADDLLTTTLANIAQMNIDSPQAAREGGSRGEGVPPSCVAGILPACGEASLASRPVGVPPTVFGQGENKTQQRHGKDEPVRAQAHADRMSATHAGKMPASHADGTSAAHTGGTPVVLMGKMPMPRKTVALSPAVAPAVREMQDFLMANVYLSGPNADKERRCHRIIAGLFEAYLKDPSLLPQRYRTRIDTDGLHRTICDFIAGMTDRYCLVEYEKHCPK